MSYHDGNAIVIVQEDTLSDGIAVTVAGDNRLFLSARHTWNFWDYEKIQNDPPIERKKQSFHYLKKELPRVNSQPIGLPATFEVLHGSNLEIGMRVGIPWFQSSCGKCEYCLSGMENLCPNAKFTGFHVNGGFAEYIIADVRGILPISDKIEDCQAAPLLCAGIIGYRSLKKADLKPAERLGLFGFGASAHLAIQVAKYWDCEVYVFTRSQNHREHARNLGASWVGGADDETPAYLDRAIIFAPVGEIVPKALEKLRPGGTLAINAIHMSPIPEMPYELIYGERTLRSVANATRQDGVEFLKLAVDIQIKSTYKTYHLTQANQALIDLKHSKLNGEAVLKISE